MKITDLFKQQDTATVKQKSLSREHAETRNQTPAAPGSLDSDRVTISKEYKTARTLSSVLADDELAKHQRIEELKKKVQDGYFVDSKKLAERIIEFARDSEFEGV